MIEKQKKTKKKPRRHTHKKKTCQKTGKKSRSKQNWTTQKPESKPGMKKKRKNLE